MELKMVSNQVGIKNTIDFPKSGKFHSLNGRAVQQARALSKFRRWSRGTPEYRAPSPARARYTIVLDRRRYQFGSCVKLDTK